MDDPRMMQLVGQHCVRCGEGISSVLEGRFCEICGNPVHESCRYVILGDSMPIDVCAVCGGNRSLPTPRQRAEVDKQAELTKKLAELGVKPSDLDKFNKEMPKRMLFGMLTKLGVLLLGMGLVGTLIGLFKRGPSSADPSLVPAFLALAAAGAGLLVLLLALSRTRR
jgi:hypothetical protein